MSTTLTTALLADFAAEAENTRKVLAAVPGDKLAWKPHEKSMSMGQLAGHLAECPVWAGSMLEPAMDFGAMPKDYQPYAPKDHADLMATFEKNAAALPKTLAGRDDAFMNAKWTMKKGDVVLWEPPRHAALRSMLIHHWIHHRGQLTVYLRLVGAKVPATYGPSADESPF